MNSRNDNAQNFCLSLFTYMYLCLLPTTWPQPTQYSCHEQMLMFSPTILAQTEDYVTGDEYMKEC